MKIRLDQLLVERGLAATLEEAKLMLMAGEVWSREQRVEKAGTSVDSLIPLEIRGRKSEFVSRAGEKLKFGLDFFNVPVTGKVCIDIGSSTGGFTDCLLKKGAQHVFAVDVGYGLIDVSLRSDKRISLLEKTNARLIKKRDLEEKCPLAKEIEILVSDVSFISLRKIIPNLKELLRAGSRWILLFKPQFELPPSKVLQGGVVKDLDAVNQAMAEFNNWMIQNGFTHLGGPESSPLSGKKSGNVEYLFYYEKL